MKKTTKFLSFLLFAPLLTGCGNGVKAPKFVDYGKEVKAATFITNITKAFSDVRFNKAAKIPSYEANSTYALHGNEDLIRNNKVIRNDQESYSRTIKYQYDSSELVLNLKNKDASKQTHKENSHKLEDVQKDNYEEQLQAGKYNKKDYLLSLDIKFKEYRPYLPLDGYKLADLFDGEAKSTAIEIIEESISGIESAYYDATDEEKKNYKFYQNGEIYSIEYKSSQTKEVKGDRKTRTNTLWKVQLDFTEGKWSGKEYSLEEVEIEYLKKQEDFAKGDITKATYEKASENTIILKDVKLKNEDVSKYKLIPID